jgi:hypothetical protein
MRRFCKHFGEKDSAASQIKGRTLSGGGPAAAESLRAIETAERVLKWLAAFQIDIERSSAFPSNHSHDGDGSREVAATPISTHTRLEVEASPFTLSRAHNTGDICRGGSEMKSDDDPFDANLEGSENEFDDPKDDPDNAPDMFPYDSSSDESDSDGDVDDDVDEDVDADELEPLEPEVVLGYGKMLRVGVPHGAVRARMSLDGIGDRQAKLWLRLIEETVLELMRGEGSEHVALVEDPVSEECDGGGVCVEPTG